MQEKKLTRAKIVIEALRQHYGLRVGEFAEKLGVGPSTVSTWANRDSLDEDLIFRKCEGVVFDFLKTGTGPMFTSSTAHLDGLPHPSSRGMAPANSPLLPPRVDPNYYHPASEGMLPANLDIDAWSEAVIDSKQLFGDIRRANVEKCYQVIMRKREEGVLTENTEDPPPAKTETPLKQAA